MFESRVGALRKRVLFVGSLLLAPLAFAQFGPTPVNVEDAQVRLIAPTNLVSAAIVSNNDTEVSARVGGVLVQVAKVGTKMKQGEVFAVIGVPALKFQHDEQSARLASSKHQLKFLNDEVKRLETLALKDLSSKNELERTVTDRDQAIATVAENEAQLGQIELNQSYTSMRAPFDGVIVERLSDVGELVGIGTAVVRIVQTNSLEISARVPVSALAYVREGKSLAFESSIGFGSAEVRTIVPVADSNTRLVEVRAMVTDNGQQWPVGLDVNLKVPSGPEKQALAVRRDALVLRRDGARVFRVNAENKAEQVMVQTGEASEQWIEISGDVNAGDKIIIRGAERLQPGQDVLVKDNNDALVEL